MDLAVNYNITGDYQWETPLGVILPLNTNPLTITITNDNNLDVWRLHLKRDTSSCIQNDEIFDFTINLDNPLSINDVTKYFSVYPNPTSDILNIVIPNLDLIEVKASVFNSLQQIVSQEIHSVQSGIIRVSLRDAPSGIYFVRLDLEKPINIKVIKR